MLKIQFPLGQRWSSRICVACSVLLIIAGVPTYCFADSSHRPTRDEGVAHMLAFCSSAITSDQDEKRLLLACDTCPPIHAGWTRQT